jgi:hypothetical protein
MNQIFKNLLKYILMTNFFSMFILNYLHDLVYIFKAELVLQMAML